MIQTELEPFETTDTIVAISTPPGRGGIGIVRLSGPQATNIAQQILRLRQPLAHATARLADIVETPGSARKLDEAVVTWFAAPHSYTTEDVVEIAAHGSPVVLQYIVRLALEHGARLAHAGEFTERAFLSGRIDLTQAEAVRDLIDAQTIVQARIAAEQMGGALSRRMAPIKELLLILTTTLEAGIDFAEDDIDVMAAQDIAQRIQTIQSALSPIAASYTQGRLVHDGFTLAIVGRPNAGKSSLFNRLVEREKAIVTPVAGTTRDAVTERISFGGIPVELVDTAGLRETTDIVEALGIEKTREVIADADIVLLVLDPVPAGSAAGEFHLDELERSLLRGLFHRKVILVVNKVDLLSSEQVKLFAGNLRTAGIITRRPAYSNEEVSRQTALQPLRQTPPASANMTPEEAQAVAVEAVSFVSAWNGDGIPALRERVLLLMQAANPNEESGLLTTLRHHQAVTDAESALTDAQQAVANHIPHEMLLLNLYAALEGLDRLTGATAPGEILQRIFSTFCIGK